MQEQRVDQEEDIWIHTILIAAMRPRSRLTKRRLQLPTIREGYEEMVKDLNQANSLHSAHLHGHANPHTLSSEDYLMSICHLAHPTFPTQDLSSDTINLRQQDSLHQRLRLPRPLSATPRATSDLPHREEPRGTDGAEAETLSEAIAAGNRGEKRDSSREPAFGWHGTSDPLEYLYGRHDNPALDICHSGSARQGLAEGAGGVRRWAKSVPSSGPTALPHHRKSSCPELSGGAVALHGGPSPPGHTSPAARPRPSTQERLQATISSPPIGDRVGNGKLEGGKESSTVKLSLVSQWISDCRSAWKVARIRACLLPAITEM